MRREHEGPATPAHRGDEQEAEERHAGQDDGRVRSPDPEEVPELLGERSDYPIPRGPPR